jgi:hypothetical protein
VAPTSRRARALPATGRLTGRDIARRGRRLRESSAGLRTLSCVAGRLRIDLFAFALGALALLSFAFFELRNAAALLMCVLCFGGLVAARFAGFSNRALVPVAAGLVLILWMVWIDPPTSAHKTSALAHAGGGALVGWALSEYLRGRLDFPQWAVAALAAVIGVTVLWELGELVGDRLFSTGLIPSWSDSAEDIFFGTFGGAGAIFLAWLVAPRSQRR